jgi:hypothetical protein
VSEDDVLRLEAAMQAIPSQTWSASDDDCRELLDDIMQGTEPSRADDWTSEQSARETGA